MIKKHHNSKTGHKGENPTDGFVKNSYEQE